MAQPSEQHVDNTQSDRKRKESGELTTPEMLQLVHAHAWMHVIDAAPTLDSVVGMPAQVWLTVLPQDDQAVLAVHFQNEAHAVALLQQSRQMHGPDSNQASRAARVLHDAKTRKHEHLAHCQRKAETMLSTGTSE